MLVTPDSGVTDDDDVGLLLSSPPIPHGPDGDYDIMGHGWEAGVAGVSGIRVSVMSNYSPHPLS